MWVARIKWLLLGAVLIALNPARLAAADLKTVSLAPSTACQVALTWERSPDTNAVGYYLYYGVNNSGVTNRVDAGNQSTLLLRGLEPGAVYQFAVTAYDAAGFESDPSNEVQYAAPAPQRVAMQPPSPTAHTLSLQFQASAGGAYRIQASGDLVNWVTVVTTNCASSGPISVPVADTTASSAQFFRMVQDH